LLGGVGKDARHDIIHMVQEGIEPRGDLSIASGDPSHGRTIAMHD
jgi:hypothetical protein